MIATGFQSKGLPQEVPIQLQSKLRSNDVVVSRQRRTIRPNGSGDNLNGGAVLDFNIASSQEWLDAGSAILHAKLTIGRVSDGGTDFLNPFPKAGWRSLCQGYTLQCKGQSLETSLDTGNLHSWNALRSRLYESSDRLRTSGQLGSGMYQSITTTGAQSGVYLTDRTGDTAGDSVFEIAVPLKEIVNFFNLDRSYIPIMAIPLLLRMTLAQIGDCFVSPKGEALPANYKLDNVYLAADFLQMDASVDDSFRRMVMDQSVSFMYPSVFITNETQDGTNINLKTNLNASNLDAVFCYLTEKPASTSSLYPTATTQVWNQATMAGATYQFYIDSRNVFSEPITTASEAFHELQKATLNDNEQYLEGSPVISATGFLNGIVDGDVALPARYSDYRNSVLAVNLSRVLNLNSISGVNVSLTGGRLMMEILGLPAGNNRQCIMFFKHTRQLVVSADFIQVIT
jgi:hypothetical protein